MLNQDEIFVCYETLMQLQDIAGDFRGKERLEDEGSSPFLITLSPLLPIARLKFLM